MSYSPDMEMQDAKDDWYDVCRYDDKIYTEREQDEKDNIIYDEWRDSQREMEK